MEPITMFDSVNVAEIPPIAGAVAGYVGGNWPTYSTLVRKFPRAHVLSIAVSSHQDAECLDVEPGDATVAVAAAWVKRQQLRGVRRPVVYCSVSQAKLLLDALKAGGIARSDIRLWTAHYNFKPHLCSAACGFGMPAIADATQWTDKAFGRNLDASLVSPTFFPAPTTTVLEPAPAGEAKNDEPFIKRALWPTPVPAWFWPWAWWRENEPAKTDKEAHAAWQAARPAVVPKPPLPPWAPIRLRALQGGGK